MLLHNFWVTIKDIRSSDTFYKLTAILDKCAMCERLGDEAFSMWALQEEVRSLQVCPCRDNWDTYLCLSFFASLPEVSSFLGHILLL